VLNLSQVTAVAASCHFPNRDSRGSAHGVLPAYLRLTMQCSGALTGVEIRHIGILDLDGSAELFESQAMCVQTPSVWRTMESCSIPNRDHSLPLAAQTTL
jgi:hypothetical protein